VQLAHTLLPTTALQLALLAKLVIIAPPQLQQLEPQLEPLKPPALLVPTAPLVLLPQLGAPQAHSSLVPETMLLLTVKPSPEPQSLDARFMKQTQEPSLAMSLLTAISSERPPPQLLLPLA